MKINQCVQHKELLPLHMVTDVLRHWRHWCQQNITCRGYLQILCYIFI